MNAIEEIKNATQNNNLHYLKLDLGSLASIREFSQKFHELETRLDILICNAGVLSPLEKTSDGFEMNMGVNHFGHFLLTNLLLDMLKSSAPSRIIIVASQLYLIGSLKKDDINSEKSFSNTWFQYANSKLANIYFMLELSRRLQGSGVTCNALCPGVVDTEAARYLNPFMKVLMWPMMKLFYSTPEIGCQTAVLLAIEKSLEKESGNFYISCRKKNLSSKALNEENIKWLWEKSEELTGLKK